MGLGFCKTKTQKLVVCPVFQSIVRPSQMSGDLVLCWNGVGWESFTGKERGGGKENTEEKKNE